MPESVPPLADPAASPDYVSLLRFLAEPLLDSPDSLRVDCEISNRSRVWLRVAFEGEDKGRAFGRGGRNLQAIRTVLTAVAQAAGHTLYLEVFGHGHGSEDGAVSVAEPVTKGERRRLPSRRPRSTSDASSRPR
ncbi:KH domain-containing protein [Trichothermofontia sichuanensis B231]|uniref:KH domain-containing protein n=1 Tax=Trichothermofontia sichuanensis TaxID=3045816 RepID=UPI0022478AE6|nr:KH domain-containing protein [Trichothermofontia sichuanensis]UZQ54072.1 KH domain-containing protein [Trichothermofontia sichuanensis B231]